MSSMSGAAQLADYSAVFTRSLQRPVCRETLCPRIHTVPGKPRCAGRNLSMYYSLESNGTRRFLWVYSLFPRLADLINEVHGAAGWCGVMVTMMMVVTGGGGGGGGGGRISFIVTLSLRT